MTGPIKPDKIDSIIHERARLAIVSALAVTPQMSFNELKTMLSLTDGNLSANLTRLEEEGYIKVRKTFTGKKPLTTCRITGEGRKAFSGYLKTLEELLPLKGR